MWWSDTKQLNRRGFLALSAVAGLSACGFAPVYGEGGRGRVLRNAVRLDDPVTRADYQFLHAVEDLLGRPTNPRFALTYTIDTREVAGGSVENVGDTRMQIFGTLDFTMTDSVSGLSVAQGQLTGNTAYSTTGTQLSSLTAQEDAGLRLMRMLAESLVTRLYTEPGIPTE
ncbi:twin-arginine translocation signal domain-containing protein [Pararhodobacter sp. CCB-MM2]|uniref:twin-arginine translocation signal domain-containing protein n=1 Tax=Pararhodobacter sp. CCB-MM2 TaxID=1786003 RepID=UPI0009F166D0|nr:twin-arginine translocation signal domain-containing protein [Pararhodobacter sp. CCB-MM2]MCA2013253.1 twin-arginine translocation signal domain-containing protein [Cereibacter sphaeroides]